MALQLITDTFFCGMITGALFAVYHNALKQKSKPPPPPEPELQLIFSDDISDYRREMLAYPKFSDLKKSLALSLIVKKWNILVPKM